MHWKSFLSGIILTLSVVGGYSLAREWWTPSQESLIAPLLPSPTPKPLEKYSFTSLESYQGEENPIQIQEVMFEEDQLTAYKAWFQTGGKKMSMQVMVPKADPPASGFPVILMNRGFVDASIYQTGVGTKNGARYFAAAGFVTVAPDYLGYGDSDDPPTDTIEARLERPKQAIDLLASIKTLPRVDENKIGIWGHSNGGQISISLLEITAKNYPTALWAPVTKPFPYSVLYYTDDSRDQGKALRRVIADFEADYDILDYSIGHRVERINGPIQFHQGTADDAIPVAWSNTFVNNLKSVDKSVEYFTYPGADHNLQPAWSAVAERSLAFFQKHLYGE